MNTLPNQVVFYDGIAVDQDIAQSDNLTKMWDPSAQLWGNLVELIESLTDDL